MQLPSGFLLLSACLVFFLALRRPLASGARHQKLNLATPNYTLYHTSGSLLSAVQSIAEQHSEFMTLCTTAPLALAGYSASLTALTVHLSAGRPAQAHARSQAHASSACSPAGAPPLPRDNATVRALLVFGQHGREPITSEIALRLITLLTTAMTPTIPAQGAHSQSQQGHSWHDHTGDRTLLNNLPDMAITIVPMDNVAGRRLVEGGNLCDRRNGRGVDLNRNWDVDWGRKEKDYDPAEEYPGLHPFSEPEAELMRRLAVEVQPQAWVNVHAGMEALFMPFDHRAGGLQPSERDAMMGVIQDLNARFCHRRCSLGSGGGAVG